MFTKVCPQCGKTFQNPASKVICCSTKCQYERLTHHEIRYCLCCHNQFEVRVKSKRKYCSKTCMGAGESNPKNKVIKKCKGCNKEFVSWAYRNQIYCSKQCRKKEKPPKVLLPKRIAKLVTLECKYCHKKYSVHECMNKNGRKSNFCSKSCQSEWVSKNNRGINHPRYIGGTKYADRGQNWYKQRRAAVNRDNYTCQMCGKIQKPQQRRIVDVHHIKPFKDFDGDYITANDLTNLITLCRKCHVKVEDYGAPCPKRLF